MSLRNLAEQAKARIAEIDTRLATLQDEANRLREERARLVTDIREIQDFLATRSAP